VYSAVLVRNGENEIAAAEALSLAVLDYATGPPVSDRAKAIHVLRAAFM